MIKSKDELRALQSALMDALRHDETVSSTVQFLAAETLIFLGISAQELVTLFYEKGYATGYAAGRIQGNDEGHKCAAYDFDDARFADEQYQQEIADEMDEVGQSAESLSTGQDL